MSRQARVPAGEGRGSAVFGLAGTTRCPCGSLGVPSGRLRGRGAGVGVEPAPEPTRLGGGGECACHSFTAKLIFLATAELTSLDAPFTSGGGPADRAEILTSFWLNKPTVRLGPTPPVRGAALWAEAEEKARPFPVAAVTSAVPVQTVN